MNGKLLLGALVARRLWLSNSLAHGKESDQHKDCTEQHPVVKIPEDQNQPASRNCTKDRPYGYQCFPRSTRLCTAKPTIDSLDNQVVTRNAPCGVVIA